MAPALSYTEETFGQYLDDLIESSDNAVRLLATQTGLDRPSSGDAGDYATIINRTMRALGLDDVSTVSGSDALRQLELVGERELWRFLRGRTAGWHNISEGNVRRERKAVFENIGEMLDDAESELARLGLDPDDGATSIGLGTITHVDDYYVWRDEEDREV